MKKVILLLLLVPYMVSGQVIDIFESGVSANWEQSPPERWSADTAESISGKYSLHHTFDNSEAGSDRIAIPLLNIHPDEGLTTWAFTIRHGYDPSSSNNWAVFLFSGSGPSVMATDGSSQGFAIGVNLTGYDDTLRLWKVKGNILTTVVNCHINWQTDIGTTNPVKIKVERNADGKWNVTIFRMNGSTINTTNGYDPELFGTYWFSICYKYSSTRDRLLWIDDIFIEGIFYRDITPPAVIDFKILNKRSIGIRLNEEPVSQFITPGNFFLNSEENNPLTVLKKSELEFVLESANEFINKALNKLIIKELCDKEGNCIQDTIVEFTPFWAETGDVIISEIMADPLPAVSLPAKEYLEITNRSGYSFDLKNWKLSAEGQYVLFPEVILLPEERRILCLSQDTIFFSQYGKVTGLKQFPVLTDGGKAVWLTDSLGTLIHGVEYSSEWYGDELKSGGGWSLEMKDIKFPFYDEGNWSASCSRTGGTPGMVNSVFSDNPDTLFYGILNVFPDDSNTIIVRFSEPLINLSHDINNIGIKDSEIIEILPRDPLFREFSLKTAFPLTRKEIYKLIVSENVKDFAGNRIQKGILEFGVTEPSRSKDILFNELLFNPFPDDPDYIELYNSSDKIIDASRLQIVSINEVTGKPSLPTNVSIEKRCIMPGSYYAVTTDRKKTCDRYHSGDPDHLFEITDLPSMPDDRGHLILYNRELDKIDEVFYNDSLHNSLLPDNEGVALAKDLPQNLSEDALNWYPESESMGWGTPGALNFNKDMEAPVIKEYIVSGKNSIEIKLSEEPAIDFLSESNFSLNEGINKPASVIKEDNLLFRIVFANELINRSLNYLIINTLCDKYGNCNSSIKIDFTPVWALTGDVIISEIMADPVPQVSLPGKEYLEITNRSGYSFSLKNWKLISEGLTVVFPDITIQHSDIGILCSLQDTLLFKKYGKVIGLKQFPALTDAGKVICLTDSTGTLIHGVEYSSDWYGDDLKSAGGWSLEMIDLQFPFNYEANWKSSSSRSGGTPGMPNSVAASNPDISFYGITNVYSLDSLNISIGFSEPVINLNGSSRSIKIDGKDIADIYPADPLFRRFSVIPADPLIRGKVYKSEISADIKDFAGNSTQNRDYSFGLSETPIKGDIKFNELLFNPLPGDPDYIELYNCSDKIIDASRLKLVSVNEATSDTSVIIPVSTDNRCIMPGTYYVITSERQKIIDRYLSSVPENLFEISPLPAMPDDDGTLILFNGELDVIDKVSYNEKMHYTLLSGFEGIALEKTGKCNSSGEAVNWHSATENSGWGTPGGLNSVYFESFNQQEKVTLSSTRITPDNDGFEDFLTINLMLEGNENVVSVSVYDETGSYVRKIVSNMLTGSETVLIWDGTADDGTSVNSGIYIILINLFDEKGKTDRWKKVCSVLK
jgi:hypothetical protein